jgi:hypothetical protein
MPGPTLPAVQHVHRAFVLAFCAQAVSASMAFGATFASEYALLRQAPPEAFEFIANKTEPDEQGFIGFNHIDGKWYEAGMQRGGCRMLIGAVVSGDEKRADAAWRAIDATFAHQIDDGGFLSNLKPNDTAPPTKADRVETAFFFLQELGRAILIIQASPMEAHFHDRIQTLEPKLRRATAFLQSGFDGIVLKCGHTANRLLIAAKAFGLCGVVLNDDALKASSAKLVEAALKRRDEDGVFIERGGRDSSYNAVSLLMGQVLLLYIPNPELDAAMVKTMAWERTRIKDTGEVEVAGNTRTGVGREKGISGKPKEVNYPEVAQALCYFGMVHDDPSAIALAKKVQAWKK